MIRILDDSRRPDVTFSPDGRITVAASVARSLGAEGGDVLDVMTDGEEYYLYVRRKRPPFGRFEGRCVTTNKKGRHLRAHSKRLCAAMLDACGSSAAVRLFCGEIREINGATCAAIIVRKKPKE